MRKVGGQGLNGVQRVAAVTGARSPAALHACRSLFRDGWSVVAADSVRFPLAGFSSSVSRVLRHPSPVGDPEGFSDWIGRTLDDLAPQAWIPTCEETFHVAAAAEANAALAGILRSPPLGRLLRAHDKHAFALDAAALGFGPAETFLLSDAADVAFVAEMAPGLVFKPAFSRFAERVVVRPAPRDAVRAVRPTPSDPWVAQTFLPGEEICVWASAERGEVLAIASYRGLHRAGLGASVMFEAVEDADVERFVRGYVRMTGWSGQVSFDMRRDGTGFPRAIECNPRSTSGIHLFEPSEGLARALLGLPGGPPARQGGVPMVGAAMLAHGVSGAVRAGRVAAWAADFRRGTDVVFAPGDVRPGFGQAASVAELAVRALRGLTSLTGASTADIEWNGR